MLEPFRQVWSKRLLVAFSCTCSIYTTATNYYVNDASSTSDTYCSAIGNNANNGLSPATPKLTLKNLWITYGPSGTNVLTSGDVIFIDAGTYSATGGASVHEAGFNITVDGLTFLGSNMATTIFDHNHHGTPTEYFMYINANNVVLKNMTIREFDNNGTQTPAGHSGQAITIGGSGILKSGILLENISFMENGLSGGNPDLAVLSNSSVTVKGGGSFCNTNGTAYTGGIEAWGTSINLVIENTILANNYKVGSFDGGGLRIEGDATTTVTVKNSRIANNMASHGGAISQTNGVLNVSNCIIEGNTAGQASTTIYGGAFRINAGTARFTNCRFQNNAKSAGTLRGGAIAARYTNAGVFSTAKTINLTIDSTIFVGNIGDLGFDIYAANGFGNACTVLIRDCQFLTGGNFNIVNDTGSPATSINVTYFGATPTSSGSAITKTLSSNLSFSPTLSPPSFSGGCGSIVVLPIELIDFTGFCKESYTHLIWETATEHNNAFFTIEKANEDGVFTELAMVQGQLNTTDYSDYSFKDYSFSRGVRYYRLSQTDVDGTNRQLKTIAVTNDCADEQPIHVVYSHEYGMLSFYYNFSKNEDLTISVYDAMGQLQTIEKLNFEASENKINLVLNQNFATGIYFVKLDNTAVHYSDKFIVVNR